MKNLFLPDYKNWHPADEEAHKLMRLEHGLENYSNTTNSTIINSISNSTIHQLENNGISNHRRPSINSINSNGEVRI